MRRIVFGVRAQRDLRQAWRYVAVDSLSAADRLTEEIHDAIERRFMVGSGGWRCDALWKPMPPSTIGEAQTPAMQK